MRNMLERSGPCRVANLAQLLDVASTIATSNRKDLFMKKVCLIILIVLLLPVTSSFALQLTETGQQIFIPYTQVGNGYWSGVAINNTSDSTMNFSIAVYKSTDGALVSGTSFSVAPHAMKVDLMENFFGGTAPSQRMSVVIRTTANVIFQATLFVGSDAGGFGFTNYTSFDWVHNVFVTPLNPDWWLDLPLKPIVIPRITFPLP
jgi:hypothetical protein